MAAPDPAPGGAGYWDGRYASIDDTQVSWFQDEPVLSLEFIGQVSGRAASVVDVGGGSSRLVDRLLTAGYRDLTVVDLSQHALAAARARVGDAPVTWVAADIRDWEPDRTFDVWHDRAAYHFLTDPDDQRHYWDAVRASVPPGGHVVMATFALDGPEACSGLPVNRWGADELARAMGEGFMVIDSRREEHVTPTGATQSFVWLVSERC